MKRIVVRGKTKNIIVNLQLFMFLFMAGCGSVSQGPGQDHASNSDCSLDHIITEITPQGWDIGDEILTYTPENLYELINGRAEFYLAYDVIEMHYTRFEKNDDPDIFINVSIYDMGTPTKAFGVLSGERPHPVKNLDIGRFTYRSGKDYFMWKGQYYIHIIPSDESYELKLVAIEMANKLDDLLWDSGEPVWDLSALPKKDLIDNSVRYYLVDAMAMDFMKNTYLAKYRKYNTEMIVFFSRRESVETAKDVITKYTEHARLYGEGTEQLNVNGIELMSFDMGGIYDIVFQKGVLVAGIAGAEDKDLGIEAAVDLWGQLQTE